MTLKEAQAKLTDLRKQQTAIKNEIEILKDFIYKKGGDPNFHLQNFAERNKAMYQAWKSGQTFNQIAKQNSLSASRVHSICNRIVADIENLRGNYLFYLSEDPKPKQTCYPPSLTAHAAFPSRQRHNAS